MGLELESSENWGARMLEQIANGIVKTYSPIDKIPPKILKKGYNSSTDLIFAASPSFWSSLGVPSGDHPLASRVSGLAGRRLVELVLQAGGEHISNLAPRGEPSKTYQWYAFKKDDVKAFVTAARTTPADLDKAISKRPDDAKIDKAVTKALNDAHIYRCLTCTMPQLDAGDKEFDAKAAAIEEICQLGRSLQRCGCGGLH